MKKRVRVAVTGGAGQIGYSLLFRLASGEVFGPSVIVDLNILELPIAVKSAAGTAMEITDCAFDTCGEINCYDDATKAFDGINWALLVGSTPRGPGMERNDLIMSNGPLFVSQGKALAKASSDLMTIVVGNPCNTNALIALSNCSEVPSSRFTAMTMLDENRAKAQLALKAGVTVDQVKNIVIWGNHSSTMYPDLENSVINGKPTTEVIKDRKWLENDFISIVQKRGAEVIAARGKSSAASAASACIDLVKNLNAGKGSEVFSTAVLTNGEWYNLPKGLVFSLPVKAKGQGSYEVVENFKLSNFAKEKISLTCKELEEEKKVISTLL